MHTFSHRVYRIHHNGDGSGDVIVAYTMKHTEVKIPCDVLVSFVAELVRTKKISALEQMSTEQLIGI